MSALDDVLLAVKEGILQGDVTGWKKVESARAELAQLRAEFDAAIAQAVQAEREAAIKSVEPYVYALKYCGDRKQADLRDMANELDAAIRARNGAGRE